MGFSSDRNHALSSTSDKVRKDATRLLDDSRRSALGQFLTPASVAAFMASMFQPRRGEIRILDPGAGTGSLSIAAVEHVLSRKNRPQSVHIVCYEIEEAFLPYLQDNLQMVSRHASTSGVRCTFEIRGVDFLEDAARLLECSIFGQPPSEQFQLCIMNPPYKKIGARSRHRVCARAVGFETVNLYAAFLGAAAALLDEEGELVAITPRSFCNGPYYRDFRRFFLDKVSLKQLHVFERRDSAFKDDDVLQESLITYARRGRPSRKVLITSSLGLGSPIAQSMSLAADAVIQKGDDEKFIRLLTSNREVEHSAQLERFQCSLDQLGLQVSTGRVVDFRNRDYLLQEPEPGAAPLIYPAHFSGWSVAWPATQSRKPNAIRLCKQTEALMLPPERFVITKRFSSKEEARRIVAAIYEGGEVSPGPVAFENHLNYFHRGHRGMEADLAWGLAAYLNSGLVDAYFRTFNGHTQVNATDLRSIRYPALNQLHSLGRFAREAKPTAAGIDTFLREMGTA